LEELVADGHLGRYLKNNQGRKAKPNPPAAEQDNSGTTINTIHGVIKSSHASNSSQRTQVHSAMMVERSTFANPEDNLITIRPWKKGETPSVTFSDADLSGIALPHNDPLVIKVRIDVHKVGRVMIDTGSSTDIIYKNLFDKMGSMPMKKMDHPLFAFNHQPSWPLGTATLNVRLSPKTVPVEFVVMDVVSPYNAILGRNWIWDMKVVPSIIHQKLKFPCPEGEVTVRGIQSTARECHKGSVAPTLTHKRPQPIGGTKESLKEATKAKSTLPLKRKTDDVVCSTSGKQEGE
jgi:hypothetical protein